MSKFINWNVNGLRAILSKGDLEKLIEDEKPDILSLEEIKMQPDQLKKDFEGYHLYINSAERKGYSGTMVLSKKGALSVNYDIEGEDHPKEGRVITLEFEDNAAVCVVLASEGYPVSYEKGFEITGFDKFDNQDYFCFHAGTALNDEGKIVTNGGRVLGVTAKGTDLKDARSKAYDATEWIAFQNKYMRHDIGKAIDEA